MIDLSLLRRPQFLASIVGALFTGLGVIGMYSFLPTLLQETIGVPAIDAAWLIWLWAGVSSAVALQVRRLANRVLARFQLALGFVLAATGGQVPVIMLTVRGDDFDVVGGLEACSDVYVIKSAQPTVLDARIHAVPRRSTDISNEPGGSVMREYRVRQGVRGRRPSGCRAWHAGAVPPVRSRRPPGTSPPAVPGHRPGGAVGER